MPNRNGQPFNALDSRASKATLQELEAAIRKDLDTFTELGEALWKIRKGRLDIFAKVAEALLSIRKRRLYREAGFKTFEQYCRDQWKWSRAYVNRMIAATEVFRNLAPIGAKVSNEAQARELARLSPAMQREFASQIDLTKAPASEIRRQVNVIQAPAPDTEVEASYSVTKSTPIIVKTDTTLRVFIAIRTLAGTTAKATDLLQFEPRRESLRQLICNASIWLDQILADLKTDPSSPTNACAI